MTGQIEVELPATFVGGLDRILVQFGTGESLVSPQVSYVVPQRADVMLGLVVFGVISEDKCLAGIALGVAVDGADVDEEDVVFAEDHAGLGLRLEVLGVQAQGERGVIRVRTKFEVLNSDLRFKVPAIEPPQGQVQREDPAGKFIEFTMFSDGRLDQVTGLDALFPEQQQAWQEWASRFLLGAAFPAPGVRVAQKWNSQEPEKSASPIAGLRWMRESTYVRDEPCRAVQLTVQGNVAASDAEPETCAVILTTAALKQDSSAKNATPEDFKLHELRTAGSAKGKNRIITYFSLKTGLLMRATEEASQQMNVTVAKADGSNRVHYDVNAKSHSEVLLVTQSALANP